MEKKTISKNVVYMNSDSIPKDVFENNFFTDKGIDDLEDLHELMRNSLSKIRSNVKSNISNAYTTSTFRSTQTITTIDSDGNKTIVTVNSGNVGNNNMIDSNIRKKCTYCGSEFNGNVEECTSCGAKILETIDEN